MKQKTHQLLSSPRSPTATKLSSNTAHHPFFTHRHLQLAGEHSSRKVAPLVLRRHKPDVLLAPGQGLGRAVARLGNGRDIRGHALGQHLPKVPQQARLQTLKPLHGDEVQLQCPDCLHTRRTIRAATERSIVSG